MKDESKNNLLRAAASEIKSLRKTNEFMGARLSGFDDALLLFKTAPLHAGHAMSEDLTYLIEKHLAAEEAKTENRIP